MNILLFESNEGGILMPKKRKDYIALNMKVDRKVMEAFELYCEEEGRSKTAAFERIVSEYLCRWYGWNTINDMRREE